MPGNSVTMTATVAATKATVTAATGEPGEPAVLPTFAMTPASRRTEERGKW
jgi:hypothetical protein